MGYDYQEISARLPKKQNTFRESWRIFKSNKPAYISLFIVAFLIVFTVIGPLFFPYETAIKQVVSERLSPPSSQHWFGVDHIGRDVFARIVNGAKISLTLGFLPTIFGLLFGILFGVCAAYFGKWVDNLIMRFFDMISSIPAVLLMLMFVAILGYGLRNLIIAITVASIPGYTRSVRALIIGIVEKDYIEAAHACGTRNGMIMVKHVLLNAIGPLILLFSSNISGMIMAGAGLSFLGLGVQPPTPEWGLMLSEARQYMRSAPHLLFIPGVMILISVLSFNLVGDGLRDILDPHLRR